MTHQIFLVAGGVLPNWYEQQSHADKGIAGIVKNLRDWAKAPPIKEGGVAFAPPFLFEATL